MLEHPGGRLNSIALSSGDSFVATGDGDGTVTIRNLSIIPVHCLSGQRVAQRPQSECCADLQRKVEALRDNVLVRYLAIRIASD